MELTDHATFLRLAIELSKKSAASGGFPVGAVIVKDGEVVATGWSGTHLTHDATHHAEVDAIRKACQALGREDLSDTVLYSSLSPCIMCTAAAYWAGISTIVYACAEEHVTDIYYESKTRIQDINNHLRKPHTLIHLQALDQEAAAVIHAFEKDEK